MLVITNKHTEKKKKREDLTHRWIGPKGTINAHRSKTAYATTHQNGPFIYKQQ